jgi:hypothetical protein
VVQIHPSPPDKEDIKMAKAKAKKKATKKK